MSDLADYLIAQGISAFIQAIKQAKKSSKFLDKYRTRFEQARDALNDLLA
jgi:hypothetical protein